MQSQVEGPGSKADDWLVVTVTVDLDMDLDRILLGSRFGYGFGSNTARQ